MTTTAHWNAAYEAKATVSLSWYQPVARLSLELIDAAKVDKHARLIDVGGGASTLVDGFLDDGFEDIVVFDLSDRALEAARARLGERAARVRWRVGNILHDDPGGPFALWHDRAVFHFLTNPADQDTYISVLHRNVAPGGVVVMATFAPDGPERCSGLPVQRWSAEEIAAKLGPDFELVDARRESHMTPAAKEQRFSYGVYRRIAG